MRKWLYLLGILALVYVISQINKRNKARSPVLKRLNESLSMVVWILLVAYTLSFLYWLFAEIFR